MQAKRGIVELIKATENNAKACQILSVSKEDIVDVIQGTNYELIKTTDGFVYHNTGGMYIVVDVTMTALYEHLNIFFDKERLENMSEEERKNYDTLLLSTCIILNIPIFATSNDKLFFDVAGTVCDYLLQYQKQAEKEPLKEENAEQVAEEQNAEAAIQEAVQEAMKEELKTE